MKSKTLTVVTGATGNIGRRVALEMLAAGRAVRVVGRDRARLQEFADRGAELAVGTLESETFAAEAFQGAQALFAMIPPNYQAEDFRAFQNQVGKAIQHGIAVNRIPHVVNLSSVGAHLAEGVGPINGLADQEVRLNELTDTHIVHLRPASFMENLLWQLPLIQSQGIAGTAQDGCLKVPMVATEDIARVAAKYLLALSFQGKIIHELHGQRDLSLNEAIQAIGKGLGQPVTYTTFPYQAAKRAMIENGLSASAAGAMVEMAKSLNEGVLKPTQARSAETTTATSIEQFVKERIANPLAA